MFKKIFVMCMVILSVSSCTVRDDIQDNIDHYKLLSRNQAIREIDYSKHTDNIEGVRFLVANYPDQVIKLKGTDFDARYQKLVEYLKNNDYTVIVNEKLPLTATIIAEVNKPLPDLKYIGISMEQNTEMQQTLYNISYGGNLFKARELYNNYKKTL